MKEPYPNDAITVNADRTTIAEVELYEVSQGRVPASFNVQIKQKNKSVDPSINEYRNPLQGVHWIQTEESEHQANHHLYYVDQLSVPDSPFLFHVFV